MKDKSSKLAEVEERVGRIRLMGGEDLVRKQHQAGKLTARERLDLLFDIGTFRELDIFVTHRSAALSILDAEIPADGVITGYGKVHGRTVFAFSQDFTVRAGTLGEMHGKKICKVMDLAMKTGVPIVGLNDSGGARIQEGVDALSGYGRIFYRNSCASGVIPQISAIMGPTAGGAVYSPAMTDWIFMTKRSSHMFITGPDVIKAVTKEDVDVERLGGALTHSAESGVAHFACESDQESISKIRMLLSYLPSNNLEDPPVVETDDPPERIDQSLDTIVPEDSQRVYDMKEVILSIVDNRTILEPHEFFAPNIIVCFARIAGKTVGIIANQPKIMSGCLDVDASDKATRFIRFCDAFNIPLLTFADVPGYLPGIDQERKGIIRHGAKLLWCYSEATVPKITVITRKAYGGSYLAMCSKDLGADCVIAWPTAEIAVMGAEGAANIIFRKEIQSAKDPEQMRKKKVEEYRTHFATPYIAAARGYLDAVIAPCETRLHLIEALEMLRSKRESRPPKKHGNIPL